MKKLTARIKNRRNLSKKGNVLGETFGKAKFKKSTEQMMKETDKELYDI